MKIDLKIVSVLSIIFIAAIVIGSASAAPAFAIGPGTGLSDHIGWGCCAPTLDAVL